MKVTENKTISYCLQNQIFVITFEDANFYPDYSQTKKGNNIYVLT